MLEMDPKQELVGLLVRTWGKCTFVGNCSLLPLNYPADALKTCLFNNILHFGLIFKLMRFYAGGWLLGLPFIPTPIYSCCLGITQKNYVAPLGTIYTLF